MSLLIIDDADLAAFAAAAMRPDPGEVVLWHRRGDGAAGTRRAGIVREQARRLGARAAIEAPWGADAARTPASLADDAESLLLLHAVAAARRLDCGVVLWPAHCGDAAAACTLLDRASLVEALAGVGTERAGVAIEVPFAELDDVRVLDLADDLGLPFEVFDPCLSEGPGPCGACPGCARWRSALAAMGMPWPWRSPVAGGSGASDSPHRGG